MKLKPEDCDQQIEMLQLLAGEEFRSGELMARQLGVSRAAVWKRIEKLRASGVQIEKLPGKGYRLASSIELLDESTTLSALPAEVRMRVSRLEVLSRIDSTSGLLLGRLRSGAEIHGTFIFAEEQTKGRGRRGRCWVSPFGRNIYVSFGWRFDGGISELAGLSLVMGIAVARALRRVGVVGIGLKWPNDLLINDAKLAGILIDIDGDCAGPISAVIGIGINFSMPPEFGKDIDQVWTDVLANCPAEASRNLLAAQLIENCIGAIEEFRRYQFGYFRAEWDECDALRGRDVEIVYANGPLKGVACGVDDDGALLLREGDRVLSVSGGEVSVRPCQ